jgi:hypothetical protein
MVAHHVLPGGLLALPEALFWFLFYQVPLLVWRHYPSIERGFQLLFVFSSKRKWLIQCGRNGKTYKKIFFI